MVIDKSRLTVLTELLYLRQSTYAVREETTCTITYRDKKSWWFGFELSGGLFVFENPYSSIAVYLEASKRDCSLQLHTLMTKS